MPTNTFTFKALASTTGQGLYTLKSKSASKAMAGGATETITLQIPAGARMVGVQTRNDTIITTGGGGVTYKLSFNPTSGLGFFQTGIALTKNTKVNTVDIWGHDPLSGAVDLVVTPNAGTLATGTITAIVYYYELTAITDAP